MLHLFIFRQDAVLPLKITDIIIDNISPVNCILFYAIFFLNLIP